MCHLNSSHDCWCCAAAGGGGGGAVPVVTWTFRNGGQWGHFRVGQASRLRVVQTNRLHFDSEWMCFQVTNTLSPGPFSGTTYYWSMVTICHETIYPSHTYPHAQSQCLPGANLPEWTGSTWTTECWPHLAWPYLANEWVQIFGMVWHSHCQLNIYWPCALPR